MLTAMNLADSRRPSPVGLTCAFAHDHKPEEGTEVSLVVFIPPGSHGDITASVIDREMNYRADHRLGFE